jgi:predicted enzyme related to lactoylglutathione lyase
VTVTHVFAGVPVADFEAALTWYERLMGRPPDVRPHDREAVWQLADSGLMYIVADAERAGAALVTLIVADLDAKLAELAGRGLVSEAIEELPGAGRKAAITDPEGNRISFAQVTGRG